MELVIPDMSFNIRFAENRFSEFLLMITVCAMACVVLLRFCPRFAFHYQLVV